MVLENTLDELVEEVWCQYLVDVSIWKAMSKGLSKG